MKTNAYNIAVVMFAISATIFGCKKESLMPLESKPEGVEIKDKLPTPVSHTIDSKENLLSLDDIRDNLVKGTWKVEAFFDDGPYGADFSKPLVDYTFTFNEYNVVFSEKNGKSFPGKWNLYAENGESKIAFDFGVQPLISINNVWMLTFSSDKLIRLKKLGTDGMVHLDFVNIKNDILLEK